MTDKTPVLLTFDLDAETLWMGRDSNAEKKPVWISQGHYGPHVGLPRILRLLTKYNLMATFFIPGVVIERYPRQVEAILEARMPIEHHSYTHTWAENLGEEGEAEEFRRGWDAIVQATGREPKGWRNPAGEMSEYSVPLMEKYGFDFSSNLLDSDSAHLLFDGDRATDILEIPFAWCMDDAPYFMYSNRLVGRTMSAPSAVAETWKLEYNGVSAEPDTHLVVAMHPQVIGRASRMWVLEEFVKHVLDVGTGEFLTCAEFSERRRPKLLAAEGGPA